MSVAFQLSQKKEQILLEKLSTYILLKISQNFCGDGGAVTIQIVIILIRKVKH